jgi:hypothetical protein
MKKRVSPAKSMVLCSVTDRMQVIQEGNICSGCGSKVPNGVNDENHQSTFSRQELDKQMRKEGRIGRPVSGSDIEEIDVTH